jgi:hypothetical protein
MMFYCVAAVARMMIMALHVFPIATRSRSMTKLRTSARPKQAQRPDLTYPPGTTRFVRGISVGKGEESHVAMET